MPTQEERSAKTVGAIRQHARRLFAEQGFDATSMNDIADAAGIRKGGVYHHFATKDLLFEDVFREVEDDLSVAVVGAIDLSAPSVERMVAGTRGFLEHCLRPDVHQVVLIDGPKVLGWRRWREIDAEHFLPLLELGLAEEAAPGVDVGPLARLLIGAIDEAVMVLAEGAGTIEEIGTGLETMIRSVVSALREPPAGTGSHTGQAMASRPIRGRKRPARDGHDV